MRSVAFWITPMFTISLFFENNEISQTRLVLVGTLHVTPAAAQLSCDGLKWLEPLSARPMLSCARMTWRRVDGGRHKSKILWLSHRRVGPRRCPGSRWSPAPGTRAPVEHGFAPDWCTLLARPGAGGRGSGAAGRGQRRQGTGGAPPGAGGADHQHGLGHHRDVGSGERWRGRGQPAVSGTPIGERCRADSPDACFNLPELKAWKPS